jgi:glycosyltransferase involved in cell wall biosynthesis
MTPETASNTPNISSPAESPGRIIYDGLNLTLDQGTGIASYTRLLTRIARTLGYDVGVVYGTAFTPGTDPLLQEVLFFDQMHAPHQLDKKTTLSGTFNTIIDQVRYNFTVKPLPLRFGDAVIYRQYADSLAEHDRSFVGRNLFENANTFFNCTTRFVNLSFDPAPDVLHCTCPAPFRICTARNIYTIHDLMRLQTPGETLETKRKTFRLFKKIADTADHIVTVSETSKKDIIHTLKVDESRVTNTYQAVALPQKYLERSEQAVANYLDGFYGLEMHGYLLFFGALEPKKTVGRLIDAFLSSDVDIPLVLATAPGWHNPAELNGLGEHSEHTARVGVRNAAGAQIRCLNYVGLSAHVSLIRGARAVVFPSPHEGFALPVLEAMMLGTPVVTATSGALTEISGDAVLLVDPDDVEDIARALTTIVNDADLRSALSRRGTEQAAKFSVARYRERMRSLYRSLA